MNKDIKQFYLIVSSLLSLLLVFPWAAYAREESGPSIIVNTPEDPGHPIKLRPFVRNRALPSRAEIAALQEERARMADEVQSNMLNGRVSAFDSYQSQNYNSSLHSKNMHHRANHLCRSNQAAPSQPAIVNMTPPQISFTQAIPVNTEISPVVKTTETAILPQSSNKQNFSFLHMAEQHLSGLFNHPQDPAIQPQLPTQPQLSTTSQMYPAAPVSQFAQTMSNAPLSLSVSPVMTAPSSNNEPSGFGSAGPPPFPLSLLPAPALKQLIRSMASRNASSLSTGPKTYFGCWHNCSTFNPTGVNGSYTNASAAPANLSPQGNFHSYIRTISSRRYAKSSYAPSAVTTLHRHSSANKKVTIKPENKVKLISYPAYSRQNLPGSNSSG